MSRRLIVVAVVLVALAIALGLRQAGLIELPLIGARERPPGPPVPRARGRIAFVREGDVWIFELNSGLERRLTQTGDASFPQWSGGGGWLSYTRGDQLWVSRMDGSTAFAVPGGDVPESATWSPRATRLAYVSRDGSLSLIEPSSGSRDRRVIVPAGSGVTPELAWASDGNRVAYARRQRSGNVTNEGIWTINAVGRDATPVYLTSGEFSLHLCCWTYTNSFVLFWQGSASSPPDAEGLPLYLARSGSSQPVQVVESALLHRPWIDSAPRSDGVALISGGGRSATDAKRLTVAEPETGAGNRISVKSNVFEGDPGLAPGSPAWAPTGRGAQALFAYGLGPSLTAKGGDLATSLAGRRIWLVLPDATTRRPLLPEATVPPAVSDERPMWARDGQTLVFARRLNPQAAVRAGGQAEGVELWVSSADGANARRVAGGLADPGAGQFGYVDWSRLFGYYPG